MNTEESYHEQITNTEIERDRYQAQTVTKIQSNINKSNPQTVVYTSYYCIYLIIK